MSEETRASGKSSSLLPEVFTDRRSDAAQLLGAPQASHAAMTCLSASSNGELGGMVTPAGVQLLAPRLHPRPDFAGSQALRYSPVCPKNFAFVRAS